MLKLFKHSNSKINDQEKSDSSENKYKYYFYSMEEPCRVGKIVGVFQCKTYKGEEQYEIEQDGVLIKDIVRESLIFDTKEECTEYYNKLQILGIKQGLKKVSTSEELIRYMYNHIDNNLYKEALKDKIKDIASIDITSGDNKNNVIAE